MPSSPYVNFSLVILFNKVGKISFAFVVISGSAMNNSVIVNVIS